jgi:hypothetical protein
MILRFVYFIVGSAMTSCCAGFSVFCAVNGLAVAAAVTTAGSVLSAFLFFFVLGIAPSARLRANRS